MSEKTREICTVVSQESIGAGIYSMWIQTDRIAAVYPSDSVEYYTYFKEYRQKYEIVKNEEHMRSMEPEEVE